MTYSPLSSKPVVNAQRIYWKGCLIFKSRMLDPTHELIVRSMAFLTRCSIGVNLSADHSEGSCHSAKEMISLSQKPILEGHLLTLAQQLSWRKGLTGKNQYGSNRSVCNKWATSFSCERFCKIAIMSKDRWCFFISTTVSVISAVCRSERILLSIVFAPLSTTTYTGQKLKQ